MTPVVLMSIGGAVAFVACIVVAANFTAFFQPPSSDSSFEEMVGGMRKRMLVHLLSALFGAFGVMSLLAGFVWFLIEKHAQ